MKTTQFALFRSALAVLISAWVMSGVALAHHGWSHYDASKVLNLSGVIKESSYANPHGLIRVQVDGANGMTWVAILAPPSRMTSRGLSPEMLKVGAMVRLVGYPHRENANEMRTERITVEGKTVELR